MTTKISKPKTRRRKTRKLSYGPRGIETLRLCFQIGGITPQQHSRFFDTNVRNSYRLLSSLSDQRLLESAPVQTNGRPRDFHFLSRSNASRGIVLGGHEAGLHERRAREHYRFHGLPQNVEHAHAGNEFYLSLLEESQAKDSEATVSPWNLWGESHESFPLQGSRIQGSRKSEKTYPDGLFEVGYDEWLSCRYLLEYESRSRPGEVLRKLDAYGAHLSLCLKEYEGSIKDWLRPVIFLFPKPSTTLHIAKTVTGALRANAPELQRYLAWRAAAQSKGIHSGRLVLFADMETLQGRGALGVEYAALQGYLPEDEGVGAGGDVVDLEAVAEEVDEVVTQ